MSQLIVKDCTFTDQFKIGDWKNPDRNNLFYLTWRTGSKSVNLAIDINNTDKIKTTIIKSLEDLVIEGPETISWFGFAVHTSCNIGVIFTLMEPIKLLKGELFVIEFNGHKIVEIEELRNQILNYKIIK